MRDDASFAAAGAGEHQRGPASMFNSQSLRRI
jgi:hypothetical protein